MSKEKLSLKELLDIATNEEPSNALMQQLVLLSYEAGKLKEVKTVSEINKLQAKLDAIENWYETDGSVGGLSQVMDDV